MLLVSFSNGYVCGLSTNTSSIWKENFCIRVFHENTSLCGMVYSKKAKLIACMSKDDVVLVKHEHHEEEVEEGEKEGERKEEENKAEVMASKVVGKRRINKSATTTNRILHDVEFAAQWMATGDAKRLDSIRFAQFGQLMSVSDSSGTIYTYALVSFRLFFFWIFLFLDLCIFGSFFFVFF